MLDFLPSDVKKEIQREYALRILVVCLALLFILCLFSLALLFPSYFISDAKERFMIGRSDIVMKAQTIKENKTVRVEFDLLQKDLLEMVPEQSAVIPSEILDTIFLNQTKGIKMKHISYIKGVGSGLGMIEISGVALARNALVSYVKLLQGQKIFTAVDFPISNLAGEKDIDFTIKMTGKF